MDDSSSVTNLVAEAALLLSVFVQASKWLEGISKWLEGMKPTPYWLRTRRGPV